MDVNYMAGMAAALALAITVLLIVAGRLFKNTSFLALLFYYLLTGLYSLTALHVIKLPALLQRQAAAAFNYLDTPLMLVVFLFFCNEAWKRNLVLVTLAVFLLFEVVVGFCFGLDAKSSVYLLGPGTLLVLSFSIFFFVHYGKRSIVQGKSMGETLMLSSIAFLYGCFVLIYYLYYLLRTPAVADVFLLYYAALFFSAILMSTGLIWIIKRSRELKALQLTRKELAEFFDN
jgi:hypothetical protein